MNHFISNLALRWGQCVTRYPWLLLIVSVLICIALAIGAKGLTFSNDYRAFFSPENPELVAFENFQDKYSKNDNILIVVHDEQSQGLTPNHAKVVEQLTEQAWKTPFASRVDSITNFQHTYAEQDDLIVADLIKNAEQLSWPALQEKARIALDEPLLANRLIANNGRTSGINITVQYPGESLAEVPKAVNYVRDLVAQMKQQHPELTFAISGISMLNNAFSEAGQTDAQTLTPIMYLVLIVVMYMSLRSIPGTIAAVGVVILASAAAMGLTGYIGIELTPISITAPTIILTLAIADSIHVLLSYASARREGMDKLAAIKESLRVNFVAVSITSITTIVGFLTLNMSDAPPFADLGNITAMGIAAAWLLSLVFLPCLLAILPDKKTYKKKRNGLNVWLGRFGNQVAKKYRMIIAATVLLSIGCGLAIPQIELNDEFVNYFDQRVEFRRDTDFTMEHLTGIYVVEFDIQSGESGGVSKPEYQQGLAEFTTWLRQQPEVVHVYSYTDIIKRLNKNMHQDNEALYRLPDNRQLAAQYLLLYEMSLPFGLDLTDRVSMDKSASRLSLTLDNLSTAEIQAFIERAEGWLQSNTPAPMHAKATGATVMFSHIFQRNAQSMLSGNAIAIIAICLIMILTLRSLKYGFLSLIPNTIPMLFTFGVWALLVGQVGVAAATVTSTSLGIIVDNTVHFLSKYLRARRERGLTPQAAIEYAFTTVGEAIFVTTLILAGGFMVLAYSTFMINAQMGMLTALAIVMALIIDFLLLPALLMLVARPSTSSQPSLSAIKENPHEAINS
ncbi:RND transporter [Pseudoalteromonas sp. CO325X]|uniref:efflux RND transporter permease subunit n=1 Tax=Pseudoalteromonas sp. CO325X TaxID=1777262 RepID=UPI0010230B48|nr:MMPL family transporter [Pseudoalteromonas sp. CO325X]RZF79147.1 RND transporter [Pseudoalteromonas sp. CO325X]